MINYDLNGVIYIIQEKKLQNIPSKGRSQCEFLKKFDRKKVSDFIDSARTETENRDNGTFQEGNWWEREIKWNLERRNIKIHSK
jgi:hypothetical protein